VEDKLWSILLGGSICSSADSEGRRVDSRKSRSKEASKFSQAGNLVFDEI
jgi:hypothetical protein